MTHVRGLHCRLVAAFILLAAGTLRAGMISQCTAPGMFPDSDLTVFVFPFVDYTSRDSSLLESPVGTELAGLIQADTLLAISRYGRVAAIRMLGGPEECQPERVLGSLMAQFGNGRRERAVIMVWGRIFRAAGENYVQSYASFSRFVPNDPGEMLQLPLGDRVITSQLASQALIFAPRHVSDEDLQAIRDRFAKENIVHDKPDEKSPGKPLLTLFPNQARAAYYMTEAQGDWIHIHTQTGQEGWILARAMLGQQSLSARLPEMKFVEGVAGYFGFRAQPDAKKAELAVAALSAFEDSPLSSTAPIALAVSKQLRGMLLLLAQNQSDSAFEQAATLFAESAAAVPASSSASNAAAVVALYREWAQPSHKLNFQDNLNRFWSTVSTNPDDRMTLTNCWTLINVARNPAFRHRFTFDPPLSEQDLAGSARNMEELELGGAQVRLANAQPVVPWPKAH